MNKAPQAFRGAFASRVLLQTSVRASFAATMLALFAFVASIPSVRAADDVANEYRPTISLDYPIHGDLTGFAALEYSDNPGQGFQYYKTIWPALKYSARPWLQVSGGLLTRYTDKRPGADTLELRPFGGVKLFLPNDIKWIIYNYTRYEFRDIRNLETHDWSSYSRVRSRFGVEFPLTSREKAWHHGTWYGLADVEPIYRFDRDTIDPLYVRGGLGYVLSEDVRLEFVYWAQFARSRGGSLDHDDNIFQLNLKIGLQEGLLHRLHSAFGGD